MQRYIVGFFQWYYIIQMNSFFKKFCKDRFIFLLNYTDVLPMTKNFFKPLYGDESAIGKYLGFIIRFWWIGFGSLYSVVMMVPNILLFFILLLFPFLPMIQILLLIVRQI